MQCCFRPLDTQSRDFLREVHVRTFPRNRGLLFPGLLCVATAYNGYAPSDTGMITRDSAGVHIVESIPPSWPPPEILEVAAVPDVDIGVREGDPNYELFGVRGAMTGPDGRIVIAEFGSRLRYFDANGEHIATLDRQGSGPGEAPAFQELTPYRGDSLAITTDSWNASQSLKHLLILAYDGTYGRDITAWYPGSGPQTNTRAWAVTSTTGVMTALADGSFALIGPTRIDLEGPEGSIVPSWHAILRLDPMGALPDTIAVVSDRPYEHKVVDRRRAELLLDAASPAPVRSRGSLLYYTAGDRFFVDVFDASPSSPEPNGHSHLISSFRVAAARIPSTDATREAYITSAIDVFQADGSDADRERYRQRLESLKSPDSLPAVQNLILDTAGNIWLEEYQPLGRFNRYAGEQGLGSAGSSTWVVLGVDGHLLGSVRMPGGLEVLEIGVDYVLGLWHDEFGVEHVRRHANAAARAVIWGTEPVPAGLGAVARFQTAQHCI